MADRNRVVLALVAAGLLVGCGTSHHPASLHISGEGGIGPELSRADLRSARADVDPGTSRPVVLLELTPSGQRKFLVLTTDVARAGRRRHRPAHIRISVNGKVISEPYIDYHVSPNGLPADNGIQIDVTSIRAAHDLAAKLNR
jgi:preprotein translocase subunit SecD